MKLFIILGAINAFIAVALGAFGAHGLEGRIPDKYLETWKTAVTYQMFHATGLMIVALISGKIGGPLMTWSGWLMFIGIILFSGSLFVLSVTQIKILGAITPLGGVSFLAAWVLFIVAVYKNL
ncbi:DUF423 domain-containing protein [Bacillus sp. CECT 9360]|uniref:DUF423 domain-containing protein n=1 Tax=Bacillus sp. CECT 9360 TaxID=2845821 RepID=UPI001E571BA0|nr:DUF423 domain-containing protein [Bacillus sp. CECT 9360]CAH0345023.1 hypothetical protein BCI9360_01299 [Bacillus sp. CECT 9360]